MLRTFIQLRGGDMFHAVDELVRESLAALRTGICPSPRARSAVLKALVALAKHHPLAVCQEMLGQPLPYDQ